MTTQPGSLLLLGSVFKAVGIAQRPAAVAMRMAIGRAYGRGNSGMARRRARSEPAVPGAAGEKPTPKPLATKRAGVIRVG
jgi:hypothetical protein